MGFVEYFCSAVANYAVVRTLTFVPGGKSVINIIKYIILLDDNGVESRYSAVPWRTRRGVVESVRDGLANLAGRCRPCPRPGRNPCESGARSAGLPAAVRPAKLSGLMGDRPNCWARRRWTPQLRLLGAASARVYH